MFTCKVVREVLRGNVYKIIFPHAIKSFGITNNPMAASKTTNTKHSGKYMLTIRTLDRREYHLTKEIFNYEAVSILAELVEAKLGFRKLKDRHYKVLDKLDPIDQEFFKDISGKDFMLHSEKLNQTLIKIDQLFTEQ